MNNLLYFAKGETRMPIWSVAPQLALLLLCASCAQEAPTRAVTAANYAGPPSGGVVVLRSIEDHRITRVRRLEGRGLNASDQLIVLDSMEGNPDANAVTRLTYSVREDGVVMSADTGPDFLVLANAESVPSAEWAIASMQPSSIELEKSTHVPGRCRIEAKSKRRLADQDRLVVTTRCIATQLNNERIVQFRDFAEGLGLVGATDEVHTADGATKSSGWRFERLEFAAGP